MVKEKAHESSKNKFAEGSNPSEEQAKHTLQIMNMMPMDGPMWTIRHKQQFGRIRTMEKESRIVKAARAKIKEKGYNP